MSPISALQPTAVVTRSLPRWVDRAPSRRKERHERLQSGKRAALRNMLEPSLSRGGDPLGEGGAEGVAYSSGK